MAKVVVTTSQDWLKIADLAGGDPKQTMYSPATTELEVPDVTQAALDAALSDYEANQSTYDAATAATQNTASRDVAKAKLSEDKCLLGILQGVVGEINLLRAEHSLTPRTEAQVLTAVESNIDSL